MENIREGINQIRSILEENDLNSRNEDIENIINEIEETADELETLNSNIKRDLEYAEYEISSYISKINDILY